MEMFEELKQRVEQVMKESLVNTLPVTSPVDNSLDQNTVFSDAVVAANVQFLGGVMNSFADGIYNIVTTTTLSLLQILEYLDDNPTIESYDVKSYVTDALTGVAREETVTVGIQSQQSQMNVTWWIKAYSTPESTDFAPTYVPVAYFDRTFAQPQLDSNGQPINTTQVSTLTSPNPVSGYNVPTNVSLYSTATHHVQGSTPASGSLGAIGTQIGNNGASLDISQSTTTPIDSGMSRSDSITSPVDDDFRDPITESLYKEPTWITSGKAIKTAAPKGKFIFVPSKDGVHAFVEYVFDKDTTAVEFYKNNKDSITKDLESLQSGEVASKFAKSGMKPRTDNKDFELSEDYLESQGKGKLSTSESCGVTYVGKDTSAKIIAEAIGNGCNVAGNSAMLDEMKEEGKVKFQGRKLLKMSCKKGYVYDKESQVCVKVSSVKEGRVEDYAHSDSLPNAKKMVKKISLGMNRPTQSQPKPANTSNSMQEGRVEDYAHPDALPNAKKMIRKMSASVNRPTQTQARPTNVKVGDNANELKGKSVTERDNEEYGERPHATPEVIDALKKHLDSLSTGLGERDNEEYGDRPKPTPELLDALKKHLDSLSAKKNGE